MEAAAAYRDEHEVRTVREVLEAVLGSDLETERRSGTMTRWRKALIIMLTAKDVQFTFRVMMEEMRGEFKGKGGVYDAPVISKTLMKSVWETDGTEGVDNFRNKMVVALSSYEMAAKGASPWTEVLKAPYDDVRHGFAVKMREGIGMRERKEREKKERDEEELEDKKRKEQEKIKKNVLGRHGWVAPRASQTEQEQETEGEKKKRVDETKIRRKILDIRQMRDKIAEMIGAQRTQDIVAFRFLLIHTYWDRMSEPEIEKVIEANRTDVTMMKLWRRAIPRKVHVQGGIYMKQALFTLRIQKEIQPLWDTLPESKETKRFREIMVHFVVKKTGTHRDKMMTRQWNEGFQVEQGKQEACGPHALLAQVAITTQRKKNIGKDKRLERERRNEEYMRLYGKVL